MAAGASSSSSAAAFDHKKYDVFISFRGEDTRRSFTSHLHYALCQKQIDTFIDDELNRGDEISAALCQAIEESHISVIVFSETYATSKWCLDELLKILECGNKGQDVIPVFYNVDPSHVRKQSGSYKEAFAKYEQDIKNNQEKLKKWKEALFKAGNLAGWDSRIHRTESELIDNIVKDVLQKLEYKYQPGISKCPFIINENFAPVESLLLGEFRTVGIWGMGGIGKTTIAKWLFEKYSSKYEGSYFLANIREKSGEHGRGLYDLRKELVSELLGEDKRTTNVESAFVKSRLSRKRVFIVIDDVSTSKQIEYLVGEHQCSGSRSRIIITTRDKHVLSKGVDANAIHEVKALNIEESLQLFYTNAFNPNHPMTEYKELSKRAVDYCKGMPLALEVLGSFLHSKTKTEWESALDKLKTIPMTRIQSVLGLSYDGLDHEEREIFLDIACFFKGDKKEHVISLLNSFGFHAAIGLRTLQDKALITIKRDALYGHNMIQMHDLIQEMGWQIVRQESIKEPGRRSRLCDPKEVYDVLKNNTGTDAVEGIMLNMSQIRDIHLSVDTFTNMTKLRFLIFYSSWGDRHSSVHLPSGLQLFSNKLRYFEWHGYLSKSLPFTSCPENLVELVMPDSHVEKLWDGVQDLVNLKRIELHRSRFLTELPDFSKALNLEYVKLSYCESLRHVHPSLLSLQSLVTLSLYGCKELKSLESEIHLRSLEYLEVRDCSSLKKFSVWSENIRELCFWGTRIEILSSFGGRLSGLRVLYLDGLGIENLPNGLSCLRNLETLIIDECPRPMIEKQKLHIIFDGLQSLTELSLTRCSYLSELPDNISVLSSLWQLELDESNIECLPASIKQLTRFAYLSLQNCKRLRSLPELPQSIKYADLSGSNIECLPASIKKLTGIGTLHLPGCKRLQSLPELPQFIRCADLSGSNIECLPESIKQLTLFERLFLENCKRLRSLPELPQSIICADLTGSNIECLPESIKQLTLLETLTLRDCKRLQSLPELPQSIRDLDVLNCTSLETVNTTRTSTIWKKGVTPSQYGGWVTSFCFAGCVKLDDRARSSILEDAYSSIKQGSCKIAVGENLADFDRWGWAFGKQFYLNLPGSRVPEWFKDNRTTEASITIELDRPSQIVGFLFCVVLPPFSLNQGDWAYMRCKQVRSADWEVETKLNSAWRVERELNSDHVYLWCIRADHVSFSRTTCNSKVSFEFEVEIKPPFGKPRSDGPRFIRIKECGVCPLYGSLVYGRKKRKRGDGRN